MNHIPVSSMAFNTVNKIMDKYEGRHQGAWARQTLIHHTTHALDHILAFQQHQFEDNVPAHLTPEQIEDVESCLVRCAFILTNLEAIKRDAPEDVPNISITIPPALDY